MKKSKIKVLIFPAGAENALEIYDAIKDNVNIEVYGASGKSDHASYVFDQDHYFEDDFYITRSDFIPKFQELLKKLEIDVLIPTHDTIALFFAKHKDDFSTKILTADYYTALICREKKKTFELFEKYDFCPKIYKKIDDIGIEQLPVFVKPNIGEGGKGAKLIDDMHALEQCDSESCVICEYLPGEEYTVDCFTNRLGELKYVGIRTRERIQMGIAFRSRTIETPNEIKNIAQIINKKLNFFGGWFFQVKKDSNGKYRLMEISCRMAGTMTLHRHKGINFSLLGIFELLEINTDFCEIPCEIMLDRSLQAVYKIQYEYDHIYLDYDDTVTQGKGIHENVILLLYQCKKWGKKVTLLTRHEGDLEESLEEHCVHLGLFDEIIHMTFEQEKSDYINPQNAIFIDNSFAERKKISDKFNIPVFDVDSVDTLLTHL